MGNRMKWAAVLFAWTLTWVATSDETMPCRQSQQDQRAYGVFKTACTNKVKRQVSKTFPTKKDADDFKAGCPANVCSDWKVVEDK